ncbi:MAG TPA: YigZ family protein [Candidatus Onthoplasma faecipullorum]|nr:YigZ family protein [Candidatus Onthoplasma faecipullorum]
MNSYELIVNKSRFIGLKYDLNSLEDVKKIIESVRKEHKKARHVCYAYVYNREVVSEKCSDDGEPKGTAGYPILNVIKKNGATNCLVIVVRYFGGILLGAGGLTRAYTKACAGLFNND